MSFVGIISNREIYDFIKQALLKNSKNQKLNLININKKNIQNIKNVKFETIVVCEDLSMMDRQKLFINNILNNSKYLIINAENKINELEIQNSDIQIITYGMNQKATVTVSSVKEDEILICLQRNIKNIKNKIIEIQEVKKRREKTRNNEIYNYLVTFILEQIYS